MIPAAVVAVMIILSWGEKGRALVPKGQMKSMANGWKEGQRKTRRGSDAVWISAYFFGGFAAGAEELGMIRGLADCDVTVESDH